MTRRRNDFYGRPDPPSGKVNAPVFEYPGFHTACEESITWAYALWKVLGGVACTEDIELEDYPVTVALDMQDLVPIPDADAYERVYEDLVQAAQYTAEVVDAGGADSLHAALIDLDRDRFDMSVLSGAHETNPSHLMFRQHSWRVMWPLAALREYCGDDPGAIEAVLERLAYGEEIDDEDLVGITGQSRYEEDVSADRIVAVKYLRPFWPVTLKWEDTALAARLRSRGWAVISERNDDKALKARTKLTYKRPLPPGARIEWHGTSYRNLVTAAPALAARLPAPPVPYRGSRR